MPYVTIAVKGSGRVYNRMSRQELAEQMAGKEFKNLHSKGFFNTFTFHTNNPRPIDLSKLQDLLYTQVEKDYYTFSIPKSNGTMRHITAPTAELKDHLRKLTKELSKILPHDAAYGFCKSRSTTDALIQHQRARSRWFLKLDIKEFFESTTTDLLHLQLPQIYPLNQLTTEELQRLTNSTTLNNQLPTGSPASPQLTNLLMIPFDKNLTEETKKLGLTYTRYADDLLISSRYNFSKDSILALVQHTFATCGLPYQINQDKIRYGSNSGRNWNLGLMYTQDYRITLGNKKKKQLHAMLYNFLSDVTSGGQWELSSVQELNGMLGYLKNVEPDYHEAMFTKYEIKFGLDVPAIFRRYLV